MGKGGELGDGQSRVENIRRQMCRHAQDGLISKVKVIIRPIIYIFFKILAPRYFIPPGTYRDYYY